MPSPGPIFRAPMRARDRGLPAGVIHHVRGARWLDRPFGPGDVPPAVEATFARGGRNLQRIPGAAAEERTAALWERDGAE